MQPVQCVLYFLCHEYSLYTRDEENKEHTRK